MTSPWRTRIMSIFFFTLLGVLAGSNSYAQWVLFSSNIFGPPSSTEGVIVFKDGILCGGKSDIWISADTGKSWSRRTLGNAFQYSIADISIFDRNIILVTAYNSN